MDRDAARFYALGVRSWGVFVALGRKDFIDKAAKADPNFHTGTAFLPGPWANAGAYQTGGKVAKRRWIVCEHCSQAQASHGTDDTREHARDTHT